KLANAGGEGGIPQNRSSRHVWRDLLEQFKPFCADGVFEGDKSGGITTRPRHAFDEAGTDRVDHSRKHDRHRSGRLLQRDQNGAGISKNDIWRERDQLRRVAANLVGIARGPANFEAHVAAWDPAELLEPLQERSKASLPIWTIRGSIHEHADA